MSGPAFLNQLRAFQGLRKRTGYRVRWVDGPGVESGIPRLRIHTGSKTIEIRLPFVEAEPDVFFWMTLHEFCHLLVATPEERATSNLGLPPNDYGNVTLPEDLSVQENAALILTGLILSALHRPWYLEAAYGNLPGYVSQAFQGEELAGPLGKDGMSKVLERFPPFEEVSEVVREIATGLNRGWKGWRNRVRH